MISPHAGGGASTFATWARRLSGDIELHAIQMPGHERRICEPLLTRFNEAVPAAAAAALGLLDRPLALFGHSLGALLAHAVAHELAAVGHEPVVLFVSGRAAPHVPSQSPVPA